MQPCPMQPELQTDQDLGVLFVYGETRTTGFCGTPYAYIVNLPVFIDRIRSKARVCLGTGRIETSKEANTPSEPPR